jgi:hypothetical protein
MSPFLITLQSTPTNLNSLVSPPQTTGNNTTTARRQLDAYTRVLALFAETSRLLPMLRELESNIISETYHQFYQQHEEIPSYQPILLADGGAYREPLRLVLTQILHAINALKPPSLPDALEDDDSFDEGTPVRVFSLFPFEGGPGVMSN